mmetsp:Transcript_20672/g.57409  ORF Transcript_20672/g.57409 Transcript_20672/m.57409 type:complete len:317 (-) Transcript_20672:535-1485(-)
MLGGEAEAGRGRAEQHLADAHPVRSAVGAEQGLQVGAAHKGRRPPVELGWHHLEQALRDVAAQEAQPLHQEAAGRLHALAVTSPVLEASIAELLEQLEPLGSTDVPAATLLDLGEDPGLYQCPAGDHAGSHPCPAAALLVIVAGRHLDVPRVVGIRVDVAVADDLQTGGLGKLGAALDVVPVGPLGVALRPGAAVEGEGRGAPARCLVHEGVSHVGVVEEALAGLECEWARHDRGAGADDRLQALQLGEQSAARSLVAYQVDWAAAVDVQEVHGEVVFQKLCGVGDCIGIASADLDAEEVLARVALEERPLAFVAL